MQIKFTANGCGRGEKAPGTPEELAQAAFAAFKKGDLRTYMKLGPTEEDFEEIRGERDGSEAELRRWRTSRADRFKEELKEALRHFKLYDAEWDRVLRTKRQSRGKTDVYFQVVVGRKKYGFKLDDCVKSSRGWVLGKLQLIPPDVYEPR